MFLIGARRGPPRVPGPDDPAGRRRKRRLAARTLLRRGARRSSRSGRLIFWKAMPFEGPAFGIRPRLPRQRCLGVRRPLEPRPADFERTRQAHRYFAQTLRRDSWDGRADLAVLPPAAGRGVQHLESRNRFRARHLHQFPAVTNARCVTAREMARLHGLLVPVSPSGAAHGRSATPCLRLWAAPSPRKSSALSASRRFFPAMRSNRETALFCEWTCPKRRGTGGFPCPGRDRKSGARKRKQEDSLRGEGLHA